jgi:hypothetical protein
LVALECGQPCGGASAGAIEQRAWWRSTIAMEVAFTSQSQRKGAEGADAY